MRNNRLSSIITGVLLFSTTSWLAGCYSWKPIPTTPTSRFLGEVQVSLVSGGVAYLSDARLAGDRITGAGEVQPVSLPMSDVVAIRKRSLDDGRTAMLFLPILVVVSLVGRAILVSRIDPIDEVADP